MKKRLELSDGSAHKFWEVTVKGSTMTTTFGRLGTDGQAKPKQFGSPAEAIKEAEKLIAEKTKKGYAEAGAAPAPTKPAKPAKPTKPASILPPKLVELIGGSCYCKTDDGEEDDVLVFDWWALPARVRDTLTSDLFGDCEIPGDYPALLGPSKHGIEWTSRTCVPFALGGVQSGTDTLDADGTPQFHRLLLIDASGAAYAIDVDGSAIPAKAPTKLASSWEKLKIKKRPPVAPAVAGALPRVKTTRHLRLVGSWGEFVPPKRDSVMVRGIKLSADGRLAVLGMRGNSPEERGASVHRVDTGERVKHLGDKHGAVAITPDGALVFTTHVGYERQQVQIGTCWDVATGAARWTKTLQSGDGMPGLAISPASELLISSQGNGIKAYDLGGKLLWEDKIAKGQFDNHAAAITFAPDGALTTAGADGVIRIWSGKKVTRTLKAADAINDLAWLPGGTRLLSHSSHLTAIWDVATGKLVKKLREWERGRLAGEIAVSPVGLIVGCTTDGKIDIWDLDGDLVDKIDLKGKVGAWCVAACPGGFVVGTGGACALRFELTP